MADSRLITNNGRVTERDFLIPELRRRLAKLTKDDIMKKAEEASIPYAPIARPEDLFDDPHLVQSGGLVEMTLPDGRKIKLPKIPLMMNGYNFGLRNDPPELGEGSEELLSSLGFDRNAIEALKKDGIIGPL